MWWNMCLFHGLAAKTQENKEQKEQKEKERKGRSLSLSAQTNIHRLPHISSV
jgi:hypothetical protein